MAGWFCHSCESCSDSGELNWWFSCVFIAFALRQHRRLEGVYWKSIGIISELGKLSHRAIPTTQGQGETPVGLLPALAN